MRQKTKTAIARNGDHAREMGRMIEELSRRHRPHQVFADFCELSALSISNAVDKTQFDKREARYLQIAKGYSVAELEVFPALLSHLVAWLESGMDDCLGKLFMLLDLGNHWKGQFFTPFEVSRLMAGMLTGDVRGQVEQHGFLTVCEPAVGAGGMVIAMADAIAEQGVNYQRAMHVTAIDVDATAAHMAYVQFSLLHLPAIVLHGNALSTEVWGHWLTPAHVIHGWDWRLHRRYGSAAAVDAQLAGEPTEAIIQPEAGATGRQDLADIRERLVAQRMEQMNLFG